MVVKELRRVLSRYLGFRRTYGNAYRLFTSELIVHYDGNRRARNTRCLGALLAYVAGLFEGDDFLMIGFTPEYRMWKEAGILGRVLIKFKSSSSTNRA
jgi:hypothetical protein